MRIKKILAAGLAGAMLFAAVPLIAATVSETPNSTLLSSVEAARGGVRLAPGRRSAPLAPRINSNSPAAGDKKAVSGNGDTYTPSKNANQLERSAPATNSAAAKNNAGTAGAVAAQSTSGLGSMLRSVGLLAGGMFLGSMLASMLGLGSGFLADMLGVIANVALIMLGFMLLCMLWSKIRGTGSEEHNPYQSRRSNNADVSRAKPSFAIPDIKPVAGSNNIED